LRLPPLGALFLKYSG